MQSASKRMLIRAGGFSAGVLVSLILYPPWQHKMSPALMSEIVRAFSAGCLGVIVAEIARKFIPEQQQLEDDEECVLTEAEIKTLVAKRRFFRVGGFVFGVAFPIAIYPFREFVANPYMGLVLCIYWAITMLIAAEIFLSINPKQRVLTRILRKRKSG
jgi:hypothetical protein